MEKGWNERELGYSRGAARGRCVCGAELPPDARFCEMCGREVLISGPVYPDPEPSRERRCPNCGAISEPGWAFCEICGAPMSESTGGRDIVIEADIEKLDSASFSDPPKRNKVTAPDPVKGDIKMTRKEKPEFKNPGGLFSAAGDL